MSKPIIQLPHGPDSNSGPDEAAWIPVNGEVVTSFDGFNSDDVFDASPVFDESTEITFFGVEDDGTVEDSESDSEDFPPEIEQHSIPFLPSPLKRRRNSQVLVACIVSIVTIICVIYTHNIQLSVGFIIAAVLFYMAIALKIDYLTGNIMKVSLRCVSVREIPFRKKTRIEFRSPNKSVHGTAVFVIPGKHQGDFVVDSVYELYYHKNNTSVLLGYEAE